jgi:hypothetical protein
MRESNRVDFDEQDLLKLPIRTHVYPVLELRLILNDLLFILFIRLKSFSI